MLDHEVPREALDSWGQSPIHFDALVSEDEQRFVFRKTLTLDDPGVAEQRATEHWPHHLPGDFTIGLTGQAAVIALHRLGLIKEGWRGHGVRIRDARWSAPVLLGETCYLSIEIVRARRLRGSVHARARFRMWKHDPEGAEIEVYHSDQEAMYFPGGQRVVAR